jgi:hypothetical protein
MKNLGHISVPPCENRKTPSMRKWFAKDYEERNSNNYKGFRLLGETCGETICLAWTTLPLVRSLFRRAELLVDTYSVNT